jgi:hypothetical protein
MGRRMSALGQKQTCAAQKVMSALPSKADIGRHSARSPGDNPGFEER